jgi:hypothetical protein
LFAVTLDKEAQGKWNRPVSHLDGSNPPTLSLRNGTIAHFVYVDIDIRLGIRLFQIFASGNINLVSLLKQGIGHCPRTGRSVDLQCMPAPETPRRQDQQSIIRHVVVVAMRQKAVGDTAGLDLQPRHLLHASSAAVEKNPGRADIH